MRHPSIIDQYTTDDQLNIISLALKPHWHLSQNWNHIYIKRPKIVAELSVEYDRWISAALLWLIYRLRHNAVDQDSELLILMQISYWSVTNAEKFWAMCKVTMCGSIIYPIRRLSYLESEPHINHDVTPYFAPPFEQLFAQYVKTLACMYRRNRSHTLRFLVSCWKDIVRPPTKPIISQWR